MVERLAKKMAAGQARVGEGIRATVEDVRAAQGVTKEEIIKSKVVRDKLKEGQRKAAQGQRQVDLIAAEIKENIMETEENKICWH